MRGFAFVGRALALFKHAWAAHYPRTVSKSSDAHVLCSALPPTLHLPNVCSSSSHACKTSHPCSSLPLSVPVSISKATATSTCRPACDAITRFILHILRGTSLLALPVCCSQVIGLVGYNHQHLPVPDDLQPEVAQLMLDCWAEAPEERPTFAEVRA